MKTVHKTFGVKIPASKITSGEALREDVYKAVFEDAKQRYCRDVPRDCEIIEAFGIYVQNNCRQPAEGAISAYAVPYIESGLKGDIEIFEPIFDNELGLPVSVSKENSVVLAMPSPGKTRGNYSDLEVANIIQFAMNMYRGVLWENFNFWKALGYVTTITLIKEKIVDDI